LGLNPASRLLGHHVKKAYFLTVARDPLTCHFTVGTQKILGRVHMCQMKIGNDYLPTSLSILEKQDMDMLIGLDMLKRHRCCIDLEKNVLRIGTTQQEAGDSRHLSLRNRLFTKYGMLRPPMVHDVHVYVLRLGGCCGRMDVGGIYLEA
jgi:hypothetical protein